MLIIIVRGSLHTSQISHLLLYPSLWLLVSGLSIISTCQATTCTCAYWTCGHLLYFDLELLLGFRVQIIKGMDNRSWTAVNDLMTLTCTEFEHAQSWCISEPFTNYKYKLQTSCMTTCKFTLSCKFWMPTVAPYQAVSSCDDPLPNTTRFVLLAPWCHMVSLVSCAAWRHWLAKSLQMWLIRLTNHKARLVVLIILIKWLGLSLFTILQHLDSTKTWFLNFKLYVV